MSKPFQIRQGDVFLLPVSSLPKGCKQIQPENGARFVLAHGEVTGHAHAIYEFTADEMAEQELAKAAEITDALLRRVNALRTAQMWECPSGEWYLEIRKPSQMRHEEHTAPTIPAGVYFCPVQVQQTVANTVLRVQD